MRARCEDLHQELNSNRVTFPRDSVFTLTYKYIYTTICKEGWAGHGRDRLLRSTATVHHQVGINRLHCAGCSSPTCPIVTRPVLRAASSDSEHRHAARLTVSRKEEPCHSRSILFYFYIQFVSFHLTLHGQSFGLQCSVTVWEREAAASRATYVEQARTAASLTLRKRVQVNAREKGRCASLHEAGCVC